MSVIGHGGIVLSISKYEITVFRHPLILAYDLGWKISGMSPQRRWTMPQIWPCPWSMWGPNWLSLVMARFKACAILKLPCAGANMSLWDLHYFHKNYTMNKNHNFSTWVYQRTAKRSTSGVDWRRYWSVVKSKSHDTLSWVKSKSHDTLSWVKKEEMWYF